MSIEEIKKIAISQLSKEYGIADYFVRVDMEDEFVNRCILISNESKQYETERLKEEIRELKEITEACCKPAQEQLLVYEKIINESYKLLKKCNGNDANVDKAIELLKL